MPLLFSLPIRKINKLFIFISNEEKYVSIILDSEHNITHKHINRQVYKLLP